MPAISIVTLNFIHCSSVKWYMISVLICTFLVINFQTTWITHYTMWLESFWVVLSSSADKESTCNTGDPGSILGSGRSPGEGVGYPLQYSWASLVAQAVMNLPAMWETWVWSLSWEDLLEKGKVTHSSFLAWRIPWTEEPGELRSMGLQRTGHNWVTNTLSGDFGQRSERGTKARFQWFKKWGRKRKGTEDRA